ncbi:hypothetical protein MQW34_25505 [Bacillus sp. ZJS3]|nr:hypothetical protein MQW34_25505 [Bacillus sp. ZJS3]
MCVVLVEAEWIYQMNGEEMCNIRYVLATVKRSELTNGSSDLLLLSLVISGNKIYY